MKSKEELTWGIASLTEALKLSEGNFDEAQQEVEELEGQVEKLEAQVDALKDDTESLGKSAGLLAEPHSREGLAKLKIILCDRYGLNHLTPWEWLIDHLAAEATC